MMNERAGGGGEALRSLEDELSLAILLAERVRKAVGEAESFKTECAELAKHADALAAMLRSVVRRLAAIPSPYERPVRRIASEAAKALDRALSVVRRCRRAGVLRRVVAITSGAADLRKAQSLVEASVADLRWLLSVYAPDDLAGLVLGLPPIASTDPILSYVWSCVAAVQTPGADRAEAATALANLALDSDRNKKIIIEEGGVPPLLTLLKDAASADAQLAAASALSALASDRPRVSHLVAELAVPVVVSVLSDGPARLQTLVAALIARMASHDPDAQEEFARENAVRPLVSLLSSDVPLDDAVPTPKKPTSIHSLLQINRDLHSAAAGGSSRGASLKERERERETPEAKLQLKIACAEALWMLSRGCVSNSRKITETRGLLCLSKLVEREKGELQLNCLMTLMEIAAAAESDTELRRSAFRTNSPAARSVVDQLLRVVQQGSSPSLQVPAMKAIGSLARTFPARETRVLSPLVAQLGHWNPDVSAEAIRALGKFASPENFLCVEHSKAIIESGGVSPLMRLLRAGEKTHLLALILLCYLALHVPSSEALERAKALGTLESVSRTSVAQDPSLKELLPKAIYQLELYRAGGHIHKHL